VKPFKFFQKETIGTLNMLPGETYPTASFLDTPEDHLRRRHLYHTDRERYYREQQIRSGRFVEQNHLEQSRLEIERRNRERIMESIGQIEQQQFRLFQATTTITVNPTLWTKVKIFGTGVKLVLKESWKADPIGVVVVSILTTLVTIIGIAKLLGA
jgi:hypothetical protein